MKRRASWICRKALVSLVLLVVATGVNAGPPGSLYYRNDTDIPIIIQGFSIVNNRVLQGRRHTLQPGEWAKDIIVAPGNKRIVVADAKQPTKLFCRENVLFLGPDQYFSIQDDSPAPPNAKNPPPKAARKPAVSKVKLVPVPAPQPGQLNPQVNPQGQRPPMTPPVRPKR
jgi:hypothetical protein